MGAVRRRLAFRGILAVGVALAASGCELDEVTLAEPEDMVVAEAYIMVGDGQDQVTAFLHWTMGTKSARDLLDTELVLIRGDGVAVPMFPAALTDCLLPDVVQRTEGVCFAMPFDPEGFFGPGSRVEIQILLGDDQVLRGATVVPEDIRLMRPSPGNQCALPPGINLEFVWTRSPGVWAYSAETEIRGLKAALALDGIEVETDSVALQGVAVSDSDTTIVFPKEFGVFDRFDLEQEVAVALQGGLPKGAVAQVVVAALDQNYVNWVRGGNFNPSGPIRVSSLRGPGKGVFGSAVRRTITVRGGDPSSYPGDLLPSCIEGGVP